MSWSVSDSGPKDEVSARVAEAIFSQHKSREVADGLRQLIDFQKGPKVSVSGSGSDASVSISISSLE